jgi:hypothetical protein
MLAPMQERQALRPAGGDVGEHQRIQECPLGALPAVGDEIGLDEARLRLIPAREGADRDLALEERPRFRGGQAP